MLFYLINRKILKKPIEDLIKPVVKVLVAAFVSGLFMRFLLEAFDKSAWTKRLSLLSRSDIARNIPFERFVLDTRYTLNLLILTVFITVVGLGIYFLILLSLHSEELKTFKGLVQRVFAKRKLSPIPDEEEPVSPTPSDIQ